MFGLSTVFKILYLLVLFSSIRALPSDYLNFAESNIPRQFATSTGENTNLETRPPLLNNHVNTGVLPRQNPTTDFTTSTPTNSKESDGATLPTDVFNNEDFSSTTKTAFINPNLSGFPINPPPGLLKPHKPSISSTLLSKYPQQRVDGAVGPFPETIQQQQFIGSGLGATANLLQLLNPLNLFKPVTDTFQNIGHVLSHPNYGPGAALLRPVQFWSAVNAAGNPSLAPFRKLHSNVIDTSKNR